MILLAVDPGPTQSAYVLYDAAERRPTLWAKWDNADVVAFVGDHAAHGAEMLAVEMVASYGMAVGAEVFDTCVWAGRFIERLALIDVPWRGVYRREVKLHLCGDSRAKDANIRQALIDRYGGRDAAIGRKASPGPLYGITGDCWSALAVAITAAETAL